MILEENNRFFVTQNLTNQLVELERHFNNLEMNKFSETGRLASGRRAVYSNKSRSRYSTVNTIFLQISYILNEYHQMDGKQIAFLCFVLIIIYVFRLPFLFLFIFGSFCEYDVLTDILLLPFQSHTIIQCVQCTELAIGSS